MGQIQTKGAKGKRGIHRSPFVQDNHEMLFKSVPKIQGYRYGGSLNWLPKTAPHKPGGPKYKNGAVSSLPFACQVLTGFLLSQLVDFLRKKSLISTTLIRRLSSCLGFIGSGVFLIGTGFTSCEDREIAVLLLSLAFLFNGFHNAGCLVNNIDIGQKYASTLLGLTNTLAIVPGMVAPIVTRILTPNDTAEEWRNMFYVCAGVCLLGTVVYGCFASGEVQEWAKEDKTEINFEKSENNEIIEDTKF
ncbi:SLC17A5 [Mytilus coruscus]|uniref:SLC17A5 n=1 Tax=Mytilus coruscus TaxID=42192 RepID=A0A6J8DJV1_MYTCO|nr:SLC17A5 [Mytilus coruscus]